MPGGGQLALVAFGNQNRVLNGNPEQTFFYKVFKRYTHFSTESITVPLEGPNELNYDTPIRQRAKIPRHADLLTNLTFVFRVPEIYSKILALGEDPSGYVPAFRWIHMLGPLLIDNIAVFVGGSKIQEYPGEWIAARATVDYTADQYLKWRTLVGDVPELHTPEWGVYGKSPNYPWTKGEYPHTQVDVSGFATAASVPEREIRVPLPLWFSESWGRALPLVSLQLHEVEVQITLRTVREIYRIMDTTTQREPTRSGRTLVIDPAKPTEIDLVASPPYDNLTLQTGYQSEEFANGYIRNFLTDIGESVPPQNEFFLDARLEGTFVYLTEKEQAMFASRELQHLVHQVQTFRFPTVTTRTKLDMDIHGLVHRILFYGRRSDAIESRNDYINLSNWKYPCQAPYWPLTAGSAVPNSGRLIDFAQRDILRSARVVIAGNEIFEEKPASFYEVANPYFTTTGGGLAGLNPGALKPDDVMGPIYQIPFGLNASDHEQPSGSLNTSRLREIQLEVQPWELDPDSDFVYDFTVFVENINTVKILNGMGGLGYAI